ncbi:tryptophan synthase subunit beta [Perlabentimonas gracilis]|uniref:tryptophan synthase subunit beta n=1 Tax=Perlabentimonas gracilis TaxID=2715279 RepID=UPI00140D00DA|nr:tryptophan synthase subunit beta [Perlabentimonas gracilis]NHB68849.1 tryptophan synthase subunit beta [Perlabentimonas gracilis]
MILKPDINGFYGDFGGAFIPEMLYPNVKELTDNYQRIINSDEFKSQFQNLLKNYVGRPTPLTPAKNLSNEVGAKIYLKREDLCHTGSHKLNNVVGQILMAKMLGKKYIIAETGAGQHGVATATVCSLLGLPCKVFMGKKDVSRQQPNVFRMKMLGAEVIPVESGSQTLKDATNEAIRYWIANPNDTYYLIGSTIGPHPYPDMVAQFQSVISAEIIEQIKHFENTDAPTQVITCVGGGSNSIGAFYHFIDNPVVKLIAAEAAGNGVNSGETAASINAGTEGIIHGCYTYLMQTNDGQITEAHSISAGLDYPGIGPQHAHLAKIKRAKYVPITDIEAIEAANWLAQTEGIIPALESAHAVALLKKEKFSPTDIVVVNISGRGDKDMEEYMMELNNVRENI